MNELTLYGIESKLLTLFDDYDRIEDDPEIVDPADRTRQLEAKALELREQVTLELAKVDGLAAVHRELKAQVAVRNKIRDDEYARLDRLYGRTNRRLNRLEEYAIAVLQLRAREAGTQLACIEGATSTLKLAKCPPSVDVRQPELVPSEYLVGTFKLPMTVWRSIAAVVERDGQRDLLQDMENATGRAVFDPVKNAIKEELKRSDPCPNCGKDAGLLPGRVWASLNHDETETCGECGGTGQKRRGVPGCELITDRVRLIVE